MMKALFCFGVLGVVLSSTSPYYIDGQASSWSTSLCGSDGLASIYTPQQNEAAKALCHAAAVSSNSTTASTSCWIGLYTEPSNGNSGPWRWIDSNIQSNFYDFQHSNPNNDAHDCVILNTFNTTSVATETFWDDVACSDTSNANYRWILCNNKSDITVDLTGAATADYYHIYSMGGQQLQQSSASSTPEQVLGTNYVLGVNTTHAFDVDIQLFSHADADANVTEWQLQATSTSNNTFYIKCLHCNAQHQYLASEKSGSNVVLVSDRVPTTEWRIERNANMPHAALLISAAANGLYLGLADSNDRGVQLYASTDKSGRHWWLIEEPPQVTPAPTAGPTTTSDPTSAPSLLSPLQTSTTTAVTATESSDSTLVPTDVGTVTTTVGSSSSRSTSANTSENANANASNNRSNILSNNTVVIAIVVLGVLCVCLCLAAVVLVIHIRRKNREHQEQAAVVVVKANNRHKHHHHDRMGVPSVSRGGDSKNGLHGNEERNGTPLPSMSNPNQHNDDYYSDNNDRDRLRPAPAHVHASQLQALHVSSNVELIDGAHNSTTATVTPFATEDDYKLDEDGSSDSDHDSDNDVLEMDGAGLVTAGQF